MNKIIYTLTITFESIGAKTFRKNNLPGSELLDFQSAGFGFTQELLHTFLASILLSSRAKHLVEKKKLDILGQKYPIQAKNDLH